MINGIVTSVIANGDYTKHTINCSEQLNIIKPGQYIKLSYDNRQYYMTISKFDDLNIELITSSNTILSSILSTNTCVSMTQPQGGFDFDIIDVMKYDKTVCIASGSGIAGIIPIVDTLVELGKSTDVLYLETERQHFKIHPLPLNGKIQYVFTAGRLREFSETNIVTALRQLGCHYNFINTLTYVCGSKQFINKIKFDLVPSMINAEMFRINQNE